MEAGVGKFAHHVGVRNHHPEKHVLHVQYHLIAANRPIHKVDHWVDQVFPLFVFETGKSGQNYPEAHTNHSADLPLQNCPKMLLVHTQRWKRLTGLFRLLDETERDIYQAIPVPLSESLDLLLFGTVPVSCLQVAPAIFDAPVCNARMVHLVSDLG